MASKVITKVKQGLHFFLVAICAPPLWFVGFTCLAGALVCVLWADKLWPNATWGNCWSYTGPRWWKRGGYIGVRASDGVKMLWGGIIPHALWIRKLFPTPVIEQSAPVNRKVGNWLLFRGGLYFKFAISNEESPHNAIDTLPSTYRGEESHY